MRGQEEWTRETPKAIYPLSKYSKYPRPGPKYADFGSHNGEHDETTNRKEPKLGPFGQRILKNKIRAVSPHNKSFLGEPSQLKWVRSLAR